MGGVVGGKVVVCGSVVNAIVVGISVVNDMGVVVAEREVSVSIIINFGNGVFKHIKTHAIEMIARAC